MRMFLPIKGPGGRALTPREKAALLILGVTLVLCVLTLLAGESAYGSEPARNPVFAVVSAICRAVGGGIVALYGLILIWSGLIYFKGESIARVTPLPGRALAALGVAIGVSGALGVAQLDTAGSLGAVVGGALQNTLGGPVGILFLFAIMLLGLHLAGQGAWNALREPVPAVAVAGGGVARKTKGGLSAGFVEAQGRLTPETPLPDDGDPSPAERTNAVTRAMEEIERSQGVTIVDLDAATLDRPTIGEEVEAAPSPEAETEEAEVQRAVREVTEVLDDGEEGEYLVEDHGLVPVSGEEYEVDEEEETEEEEEEEAEDSSENDPYARGGLIRRLRAEREKKKAEEDAERPYSSFDWRGRPLD